MPSGCVRVFRIAIVAFLSAFNAFPVQRLPVISAIL